MYLKKQFKDENVELRRLLFSKVHSFNQTIKSGFNFGTITKKHNPKEYFAGCVFNKIYFLGISIENSILTNDVFLSIYLFRYIYELYIKVFYIFSGSPQEILLRLNEFFENKKWKFSEIKSEINNQFLPPDFKENHEHRYKLLSRFVHPDYESFKLCLNKTDDQQFEFLEPNVNLTIWYSIEIIKYFSNIKILNFHINIDQKKLEELQNLGA